VFIPKERLRHPPPTTRWPTAEEARAALLFSPLRLASGLELSSRSWVPAMVPWRATEDGLVTREVLDWYGRFADGRPAGLVVEATGIRDVASGPLLRIGHDRFVPGLRALVDVVRERSRGETRLFVQIIDFLRVRRRPDRARFLSSFLAIRAEHRVALGGGALLGAPEADVRAALLARSDDELRAVLSPREHRALTHGDRELVTDVDLPHVAELPRVLPGLFADAAARARDAGFDGVELHYAHAYTMASFLSRTNTRTDGYGGAREQRLRLPLEVLGAVRARVGAGFTVGARILADEVIPDGHGEDDATFFAVALAQAGLDFLSLSTGGKFDDARQPKVGDAVYPYTGKSGFECMPPALSDARGPHGRHVAKHGRIRRAVRAAGLSTPVAIAGGIGTFERAEQALREEDADLIGAARQSLADPDWWLKVREGRGESVRRCIYSNYCEGLDQKHRTVTCRLWDRLALDEPGAPLTDGGGRRLVAPRSP
jgi:2,4-dienoyl-CoA reductase-like NADH-dependent reductase (Old Yellow Enzyme family)